MIDLDRETPLTLSAAAATIPNRKAGRGVNSSTVWRWVTKGSHGVRLESVMLGGTRYTSAEALHRFFAATTAAANGDRPPTVAQRKRAIDAAERELEAAGI